MELTYRDGGSARASRADAIDGDVWYLLKNVARLRLTYQIRLLTFAASEQGARLVIRVPRGCTPSRDLTAFIVAHGGLVRMEPVG